MKIDIFSHIVPRRYWETVMEEIGEDTLYKLAGPQDQVIQASCTLWDLDQRFRILDRYEGLLQVLTPSIPALELIAQPRKAVDLAKLYNDEMAQLIMKYPNRFLTAAACLPMNDIDAALSEAERSIGELGFRGILIHTPIDGNHPKITKPLDIPELIPIYEMMSGYDLPIWIHPNRGFSTPDYTIEKASKYMSYQCFGWPYETTLAMARLVYSGILEEYPKLKLITHHCGAMVPYFADRISTQSAWYELGLKAKFMKRLDRPPIEYFHRFYADTAVNGSTSALMCAYEFFGAEHLLFGTDMPFDEELGDIYIRETINSIERMDIPTQEKQKIFEDNARALLNLDRT